MWTRFYDANYYVHEIFHLQKEAEFLKADAIAFDCEPYGESIFKPVFKDSSVRSRIDLKLMNEAVTEAVDKIGPGRLCFAWRQYQCTTPS